MENPLHRWRTKEKKITRKKFAEIIGCSESMVYRLELPYRHPDSRIPSPEMAFKIEKLTGGKVKAKNLRMPQEAMREAI